MRVGAPFHLHELHTAPEESGIYAWYYVLALTDYDVRTCVHQMLETSCIKARKSLARDFLNQRVFRAFSETPYNVEVKGALKPRYIGQANHVGEISDTLLERLANDPLRLTGLRKLLSDSVPYFASPIYIGMAKNLRLRLLQHKTLLERYQSLDRNGESTSLTQDPDWDDDHSFAFEAAYIRRLRPSQLRAYVMPCMHDPELRNDFENLLNRINYPLCGRN